MKEKLFRWNQESMFFVFLLWYEQYNHYLLYMYYS